MEIQNQEQKMNKLNTRYNTYRLLEHLSITKQSKENFQNKKNKFAIKANEIIKNKKGLRKEIETVSKISDIDFKKNYINKSIPVVLKGKAKDWNCIHNWHPEKLAQRFGKDPVSIMDTSSRDNSLTYEVHNCSLAEVIKAMEKGDQSKYSRFNRLLYDHPELIHDFDFNWLYKMRCKISSGKTFQVFLGAKGTRTQLHAASEHNLFTQVYGKKHWYILKPKSDIHLSPPVLGAPYFHTQLNPDNVDLIKYPQWENIDVYECTLEPGDVLFNPPSYWHHVTNLTSSIGVGFRWFGLIDCFKQNWAQTLLTLTATNPPIWFANKNRTDFPKIFNYMKKQNLQ